MDANWKSIVREIYDERQFHELKLFKNRECFYIEMKRKAWWKKKQEESDGNYD